MNSLTWREYIKWLRKEIGATQKELGDLLGVDMNTIGGWESRGTIPSPIYRDIMSRMSENIEGVRAFLDERRRIQYPSMPGEKASSSLVEVGIGVGVAFALFKFLGAVFGNKGQNQNQNQNPCQEQK